MKLVDVLRDVDVIEISDCPDTEISGIACDSRLVGDGFLFAAIRGQKADGHVYVPEAVSRGARAILCESADISVGRATRVRVSETRRALAQAAANFHANPSKSLGLVGVTGTNGKTTVCHLIRNIFQEAGWPSGMIGTIEYCLPGPTGGDETLPAERTTPDPLLLNSLLSKMRVRGCRYAVMEVSSHSLDQHRVRALDFDVAVFTNLTRDHLDYHLTMENYLRAKALLFESLSPEQKDGFVRCAVVCTDQAEGEYIVARTAVPVVTYGFNRKADITAESVRLHPTGSSFTARTPWGHLNIEGRLIGRHNVCNILGAVGVGLSQGVGVDAARRAVRHARPIPGRLEFIPNLKRIRVVVDYAHTDNALKNVLTCLREITPGRLIVVFGCGGDRDRGKRKKMGRVARRLADFTVITSDNPRTEDPMEIISEIVAGHGKRGVHFTVEPDRREAIAAALSVARKGDTVLIAGKGHETYQEFDGYRIDFDDQKVARELIG